MAAALRQIRRKLHADTVTIYLLTPGAHALGPAMSVDTPLGFTLTPAMPADDVRYATAEAYQSGRVVIKGYEGVRKLVRDDPSMIQYVPYPVLVVSAPLRTERTRFGALTLRWVPPRDVDPEALDHLVQIVDQLALDLEQSARLGASMDAPSVPLFISELPREASRSETTGADEAAGAIPDRPSEVLSRSTTFLYQFQRLAAGLASAECSRDVVAVAQAQVVDMFGGTAMVLCLADNGRLNIAGSAGFSKEDLRGIDGLLLTRSAPETDATVRVQPLFFATGKDLHTAYPHLDRYDDKQAWFFLPLIANSKAVGCCVLAFESLHRIRNEELAVLMTMLGQVGQSLQRARAYEVQHAIARTMQQALLPRALPHLPEIVTTARYLPATAGAEVGGDWYDEIRLPSGGIGLVIGDVEGHSLEAGAIMGQLRSGVRAYATEGHEPAAVLARTSRLLAELDTDVFATCCCLWLDLETGTACIASAGHPAPVIVQSDGQLTTPQLSVGPPLGVDPQNVYDQKEMLLATGSVVALYTDGLLDAGHLGLDAGVSQLHHRLAGGHGEDLEILADRLVSDPRPEGQRDDDTALLLVRYEGAQEASHGRIARVSIQRHDVQHVRHLRHFLHDLLPDWGLAELLDDLELLVSEVATNALIHAHTEVDVRLRSYPDHIRVEVRDSNPRPPVLIANLKPDGTGSDEDESGRGMLIVDALASAWGSSPAGRGKTTWFELDLQPAPDTTRQPHPAGTSTANRSSVGEALASWVPG
jgi:serine phosphatase RsbU (regulator of sigma subunit)/anti-sigma regulatory factor (Ser/Thr protein kinase)